MGSRGQGRLDATPLPSEHVLTRRFVPPYIKWGKRNIRVTMDGNAWYADPGEPGFMVVISTVGDGYYQVALENRSAGIRIPGERKLLPSAAVANLQRTLKAIRRAAG